MLVLEAPLPFGRTLGGSDRKSLNQTTVRELGRRSFISGFSSVGLLDFSDLSNAGRICRVFTAESDDSGVVVSGKRAERGCADRSKVP